jgi:hypothetical protein
MSCGEKTVRWWKKLYSGEKAISGGEKHCMVVKKRTGTGEKRKRRARCTVVKKKVDFLRPQNIAKCTVSAA